jgi:hypothetical protein
MDGPVHGADPEAASGTKVWHESSAKKTYNMLFNQQEGNKNEP